MNRGPESSTGIAWRSWSRDAFAQAASGGKPVLLSLGASWCRWSAEMRRTTYADPVVCDLVAERFVPVWVDADRRPDVNERYNLGGWPTTAFLTADGQLLGGETFVPVERMRQLLGQVAAAEAQRREDAAPSPASTAGPPGSQTERDDAPGDQTDFVSAFERRLSSAFDQEYGGFGTDSKRIHASAVGFGLRRVAAGQHALREVVGRTLDAIGWGGLYDEVDGGVFRYCAGRDWTIPHVEKLADVNAAALELLLDGWMVLGEERYRDRAVDLIRYVRTALVDRDGRGFFASQFADDDYYDASPQERAERVPPEVDRSVYTDSTAQMASAFLRAAAAFDDASLLECAVTSLEHVVAETYRRGEGIAHSLDGAESTRGLFRDQVAASDTLLDAYLATDRDVYLDMAQELMRFSMRALWNRRAGGFVDRVIRDDDVGLLREPLALFEPNCYAARVLARLGRLTDQEDFLDRAAETLSLQWPKTTALGIDAAPWALAAIELRV